VERKKPVDLDSFVDGLKRFETDVITKDRVTEYCSELRIKDAALSPYLHFRPDRYTRNLIYQDRLFEVMVICWEPGQKTPVHSHNGQLGWMLVERGGIDVTNFRYLSCNTPENQNVVGIDCLGGATAIDLETIGHESVVEAGPVSTVDKIQTIHRIEAPSGTKERAVTLHIYSTPFESCVAFDLEKGRCVRRNLFWDTRYGAAVADTPPAPLPGSGTPAGGTRPGPPPGSLPLVRTSD